MSYCTIGCCEEETREGRSMCPLHEKRWNRGKRGAELTAPVAEELTPKGKLVQLALDLADADGDVEYQRAESALIRQAQRLGPALSSQAIRDGLDAARKRGVRLGRPPRLTPYAPMVHRLVKELGSKAATARALGITPRSVRRLLAAPQAGIRAHSSPGGTEPKSRIRARQGSAHDLSAD